jgi:hypothetical protein
MEGRWFGDESRFAIEVGESCDDTGVLRRVDVWAAGIWLTCDDNIVNVPHFVGCLTHAVDGLLVDPTYRRLVRPYPELSVEDNSRRLRAEAEEDNTDLLAYLFMDWGPTADNVTMLLFREGGTAYLPFAFWRPEHHKPSQLGQVFVATLPERELALVLHQAAWFIMWAWADRKRSHNPTEPGDAPDRGGT